MAKILSFAVLYLLGATGMAYQCWKAQERARPWGGIEWGTAIFFTILWLPIVVVLAIAVALLELWRLVRPER